MPWLTVVIFLPLIGVPVLLLWRGMTDAQARWLALVLMVADLIVAFGVLGAFDAALSGYQLVERSTGSPRSGCRTSSGSTGSASGSSC
jgi:NADH:ubiquinone oxidoreductase subunit 4 (subunit M)